MKKPKQHQRKAIKAVIRGFETHNRGKLIMACGTGKTLIAGWIREAMKAGCTLFMAPSNALLAQTLQAWREVSKTPFEALAVCSDASVANGRDEDLPVAHVGAAVTTDYQEIAKFISSTGNRVVLCTYQSSEALALAMSLVSVPEFDLVIADEAHRTTGGADHLFTTVTHPDRIRAAKRLFMTATPRLYFDNHVDEIVSMDNEELYGPTFHELDFAEAIKLGLLTDYELLIVGVSPEAEREAEQLIKTNPRLKVADRHITARNLAVNIAILRAIKERKLKRVITFHNSCPKASAAADFLPQLQEWMPKKYQTNIKLWARTVNHTMDIGDRHELMRQFVALKGPGVLTNARCLGEGVDVPTVDAIAFMDSKKSKIEIAQSVGRAIRLSPGKEKSYIILPVIMLPGDDQEQVNGRSFKPALDVINALRAHDSTLMDQMQHWNDRKSNGVGGLRGMRGGDGGRKITFDVPADCDQKIAGWFVTRVINANTKLAERLARLSAKSALSADENVWLRARISDVTHGRVTKRQSVTLISAVAAKHGVTVNPKSSTDTMRRALHYCLTNGFRPTAKSRLGQALNSNRYDPDVSPDVAKLVTQCLAYPTETQCRNSQRLLRMADELEKFVKANGCRPPATMKLNGWFSKTAKACRSQLDSLKGRGWFDKMRAIPSGRHGGQLRGDKAKLQALRKFCHDNARRPNYKDSDTLYSLTRPRVLREASSTLRRGVQQILQEYPQ
ncbi:MAG: DEAD/DEAH box helicase family protein [Phycisphaerae bacterium]|jgi:superfamily II DNA or RNA helicase